MIGSDNGSAAETLPAQPVAPEIEELPEGPGLPPEPPEPSEPSEPGGSRIGRWLIAGAVGLVLLAGVVVAVLASSSTKPRPKPHPAGPPVLTPTQIAADAKASTLKVIAYGNSGSPLVQLGGGSTILDAGSAWVFNASEGLVVTDAHVVSEAKNVKVGFDESTLTGATIVGMDLKDDIAVLKVSPALLTGMKTLPMASPASVQQGETAYALGFEGDGNANFLGAPLQLTAGSVSAVSGVNNTINVDPLGEANDNAGLFMSGLIETDVAINPGNSGGPLLDTHGRLIGMNNAASQSADRQSFAIPVGELDAIVPQLAEGHSDQWPGFGVLAIPPDLANKWNVQGGLIVTSVAAGTPADQVGMAKLLSDATNAGVFLVIYKINGTDVYNEQEYVNALSSLQSEENFTVDLVAVDPQGNLVNGTATTLTLTAP